MLPGFRFVVAAIVFSCSVIIFGLGAAALFRAAHEQFASSSSWRATPETSFTAFLPQAEPTRPMIAMLRIEPTTPDMVGSPPAPVEVQTDASTEAAPDEAPASAETPEPAQQATSEEVTVTAALAHASADVGTTQMAMAETTETAPPNAPPMIAESVTPAAPRPDNADIVLSVTTPPTTMTEAPQDATPAVAEVHVPASPEGMTGSMSPPAASPPAPSDPIALKLALLGELASSGGRSASLKVASIQLRRSIVRKRMAKARMARERLADARRARRRQMAQRAHAVRSAAVQQQQQAADPFAQPQGFGQTGFGQQTAQRTR